MLLNWMLAHAALSLNIPNHLIQHSGVGLGIHGVAGHIDRMRPFGSAGPNGRLMMTREVGAVTAALLITRKSCWEEVGGMDESLPVNFNDVDYCLRLLDAGYRVLAVPHASAIHYESISREKI